MSLNSSIKLTNIIFKSFVSINKQSVQISIIDWLINWKWRGEHMWASWVHIVFKKFTLTSKSFHKDIRVIFKVAKLSGSYYHWWKIFHRFITHKSWENIWIPVNKVTLTIFCHSVNNNILLSFLIFLLQEVIQFVIVFQPSVGDGTNVSMDELK